MQEQSQRAANILAQEPRYKEPEYHDIRYVLDPVQAIQQVREELEQNKAKYHNTRRELVATGYANGLRLMMDEKLRKRLLEQAARPYQREITTPRDLFREVFRTEEGNKLASKHAKVAWVLFENDIHPEHAAGVIERSGGIEKIAQTGKLYEPVYCETADCGDGYDNWGRKLYDDDDEEVEDSTHDQEEFSGQPVTRIEFEELMEQMSKTPVGEGRVLISAKYDKIPEGTLIQIDRVRVVDSESPAASSDPNETDFHPELGEIRGWSCRGDPETTLEIEAEPEEVDQVLRLAKQEVAELTVIRIPGDGWQRIVVTKVRVVEMAD
jgi:hypothetical protein